MVQIILRQRPRNYLSCSFSCCPCPSPFGHFLIKRNLREKNSFNFGVYLSLMNHKSFPCSFVTNYSNIFYFESFLHSVHVSVSFIYASMSQKASVDVFSLKSNLSISSYVLLTKRITKNSFISEPAV